MDARLLHRAMCLFAFAFSIHCAYSQRDGQAELTLVALVGYVG